MTLNNLSSSQKLLITIGIHFFINLTTSFLFFLNDFSFVYQVIHSIIHLSFFLLIYKWIYCKDEQLRLSKKTELFFLVIFIALNLFPFSQAYEPADSGFVSVWAKYPQTNFGIPNTFLRVFDDAFINQIPSNPLLHLNLLFLNLYILGGITVVFLHLRNKLKF